MIEKYDRSMSFLSNKMVRINHEKKQKIMQLIKMKNMFKNYFILT